jgi:hypothetical protein
MTLRRLGSIGPTSLRPLVDPDGSSEFTIVLARSTKGTLCSFATKARNVTATQIA